MKKTANRKCYRQTEETFWANVDIKVDSNECWEWLGYVGAYGYGALTYQNKSCRAHRLAYIFTHGELPKINDSHGACVLHKCDNRLCVNPNHLFIGTQTANMRDMRNKNRQAKPYVTIGSKNKASKLTESDIPKIFNLSLDGESVRKIAKKFNVSHAAIQSALKRKTWAHVKIN